MSTSLNVQFQKISIPPPQRVIGNSEGVGRRISKAKIFIGKYEAKLEFPEEVGVGVQTKNHPWGRYMFVLLFSGTHDKHSPPNKLWPGGLLILYMTCHCMPGNVK